MAEEEIIISGKKFISLRRASELSGYHRDYIGQLCRGKKIEAEQIGRDWFVNPDELVEYKNHAKIKKIENGKNQTTNKQSPGSFSPQRYSPALPTLFLKRIGAGALSLLLVSGLMFGGLPIDKVLAAYHKFSEPIVDVAKRAFSSARIFANTNIEIATRYSTRGWDLADNGVVAIGKIVTNGENAISKIDLRDLLRDFGADTLENIARLGDELVIGGTFNAQSAYSSAISGFVTYGENVVSASNVAFGGLKDWPTIYTDQIARLNRGYTSKVLDIGNALASVAIIASSETRDLALRAPALPGQYLSSMDILKNYSIQAFNPLLTFGEEVHKFSKFITDATGELGSQIGVTTRRVAQVTGSGVIDLALKTQTAFMDGERQIASAVESPGKITRVKGFFKNSFDSIVGKLMPSVFEKDGERVTGANDDGIVTIGTRDVTTQTIENLRKELEKLKERGVVIDGPISERLIVERVVQQTVSGVSPATLEAELQILNNRLMQEIVKVADNNSSGLTSNFKAIALTQKIDTLRGTTLTNITVNGVTGLTDADIPDDITITSGGANTGTVGQVGFYASAGKTISGTSTLFISTNGRAGVSTTTPGALFSVAGAGLFQSTSTASVFRATDANSTSTFAGVLDITNTSGTSTFANGIRLTAGCFRLPDGTCAGSGGGSNAGTAGRVGYYASAGTALSATTTLFFSSNERVGVSSTTPWATFSVDLGTTSRYAFIVGDTGTTSPLFVVDAHRRVGVGTTTPGRVFSVQGNSVISGNLNLANLNATGTITALSYSGTNATTTNLAISNLTSGSVLFSGASGKVSQNNSNLFWDNTNSFLGIGSTTPWGVLSVEQPATGNKPLFVVGDNGTTTPFLSVNRKGYVGIGTNFATSTLSVSGGNVNFVGASNRPGFFFNQSLNRVGIGTTTPWARLSVAPIQGNTSDLVVVASTTSTYFKVSSTGTTTISNLVTGAASFDTNAGAVTWINLPVTSSAAVGTVERYSARIDDIALLTIYARSDGKGSISGDQRVGISTTTPWATFSVEQGTSTIPAFVVADTGTSTPFLIVSPKGRVGVGTTTPGKKFSVQGNSVLSGSLNVGGTLTATSSALFATSGGKVGIGATSTPAALLGVAGNAYFDSKLVTFASSSASQLILAYRARSTSTIPDFQKYAFSIATSSTATPIFTINTLGNGKYATTTFNSGFVIDGGAFQYDYSKGVTSIDNLQLGSLNFDTNAGIVSWIDMPVTSGASNGTIQSYSAQLDGNAALTIFGRSTGSGGIHADYRVGIGTTTPWGRLSVEMNGSSTPQFVVADTGTTTPFLVVSSKGRVGIGTTTPIGTFSIEQRAGVTKYPFFVSSNGTSTPLFVVNSKGYVGIGVTSPTSTLQVAGGNVNFVGASNRPGFFFNQSLNRVGIGTTTPWARLSVAPIQGNTSDLVVVASTTSTYFKVSSTGTTTISNLVTGSLGFETNAGLVTAFDMPVTSAAAAGTVEGYVFQNDASSTLTIYAESDGAGGVRNNRVGIGTTTPRRMFEVSMGGASVCTKTDASCPVTDTAGDIYATSRSGGAIDVAEWIKVGNGSLDSSGVSKILAGDVVCVDTSGSDKVVHCSLKSAGRPIGVASTRPHLTMGAEFEGPDAVRLALSGRVPVKVSTANGDIKPGDAITASSVNGVGMKAKEGDFTVGIALKAYSGGDEPILVLMALGYVPGITAAQFDDAGANLALGDSTFQTILGWLEAIGIKIAKGALAVKNIVTDKITANSISANKVVIEKGIEMKDSATGETYCVRITSGEWSKFKGTCGDVPSGFGSETGNPNDKIQIPNENQNPNNETQSTSNVTTATTTTTSTTPTTTPTITPTPVAPPVLTATSTTPTTLTTTPTTTPSALAPTPVATTTATSTSVE